MNLNLYLITMTYWRNKTPSRGPLLIVLSKFIKSPRGTCISHRDKICNSTSTKKKNKKGGLFTFLSGALDGSPKSSPPPTPKSEGPAWVGVKFAKGSTSLCDIQNEQSKVKDTRSIKSTRRLEEPLEAASTGYVRLSSFLPGPPSSPIAVVPSRLEGCQHLKERRVLLPGLLLVLHLFSIWHH